MIAQQQPQSMPVAEYLEWEPLQDIRYEFVWGQVYAMTGGSVPHNLIALNLYTAIRGLVRQQGCQAFVADVKLQVNDAGLYRYPDVMVSCDSRDRSNLKMIQYPCLIVEVLSPGTEALDRGRKFAEYRKLPTLQEYLLISADTMGVECFRRQQAGFWLYQPYGEGDIITLESIGFTGPIDLIYDELEFGSETP